MPYYDINPRAFNPLYFHLKALLRDPSIRNIFIEGSSSAGKTYTITQALGIDQLEHDYSSIIFRRFHVHIKDTVYSSFQLSFGNLEFTENFYHFQQDIIKSKSSQAVIKFKGLDDPEGIKGIERFNVLWNNEWNQFTEEQYTQQQIRLRGRPNQKIICDWNPVSSKLWFYDKIIDATEWTDLPLKEPTAPKALDVFPGFATLDPQHSFKRLSKDGHSVWIKTTYTDNYWIVGHPSGKGGFDDQRTKELYESYRVYYPNLYRVYVLGERGILRTGGELWKQFNEEKHVKPLTYDDTTTVHVSIDENLRPYVTLGIWQGDMKNKVIRQIAELPCRSPENNAVKAALKLARWLDAKQYEDVVFIYGDPSAGKGSTIDVNNSSFYDKFISTLKEQGYQVTSRVKRAHPAVALSIAFVNQLYEFGVEGWTIEISDECKVSIDDYIMVKELPDGTMEKKKIKDPVTEVSYEPWGHFSDQKRYFCTTFLYNEWTRYRAKFTATKYDGISTIERKQRGTVG